MAVTIRLARHGRHKLPYYRIVAADKENPRDGRFLEQVGTFNPLTDPGTFELREDRIKYWLGVGARPSDTVSQMLEKKMPGFLSDLEKKQSDKIRSRRAARKSRNKARVGKSK